MANPSLFDYINSINDKNHIFVEEEAKNYSQYMVNRFFSHFPETVMIANELDSLSLSDRQHYDFLFHFLQKRKRITKWAKPLKEVREEQISDFWELSIEKSREVLRLLNDEELEEVSSSLDKGGRR